MQIDVEKSTPPPLVNSVCVECGAHVPVEFRSCDALSLSVLTAARLKSVAGPPRLAIDAFALQHPKRACKSAKSYAGHLAGLCCGLEYAGSEKVHRAIQQWLSTSAERIGLTRPQEPDDRGRLTVQHIFDANGPADFDARVREWANEVWHAYASQHHIAKNWVETALKNK